jgi:hypothetical protein
MPKYRLHDADGNDMGEMRLGDVPFNPGDEMTRRLASLLSI